MLTPNKDQVYTKFDDLRKFVDKYATANNFKTILWNTRRSKKMNFLLNGKIVCNRYGHYTGKKSEDFETRHCNCPFAVSFKHMDGVYHITNVILTHNHDIVC